MVDRQDPATRLRAAGTRWTTVAGTFRTWRAQELVTRAFLERHGLAEGTTNRSTVVASASREMPGFGEEPIEHVLRVHATDGGRRRRAEALSRSGEEWMADLVVVDEPWFWSRTGDRVETNDGDPNCSHGGADFFLLLTPVEVPDGFDLATMDKTESVAGRPCDVVVATPKPQDPYGNTPGSEVFDMVSGGHEFRLHVDQETWTLLRVVKLVDGVPAEVGEFLDVAFDEPVDPGLFGPLTSGPENPSGIG